MDSGQLVLGNYWIDVRPTDLWPDVFMTGPRQQRRLRKADYIDGWSVYTPQPRVVLLVEPEIRKPSANPRLDARTMYASRFPPLSTNPLI